MPWFTTARFSMSFSKSNQFQSCCRLNQFRLTHERGFAPGTKDRNLRLTPTSRVVFIGNSLPRRCGIATFTTDLQQAVAKVRPNIETAIVAMTDHGHSYDYPSVVRLQINDEKLAEYSRAADFLNEGHFQIACLQHEFGIFGGDAGNHIMALLSRLSMPIITT